MARAERTFRALTGPEPASLDWVLPDPALLELGQAPASPVLGEVHGIPVLALDADWLVVVKPAGLLSVPGRDPAADHLLRRLAPLVQTLTQTPQAPASATASNGPTGIAPGGPFLVVHRLDQATSGVMVLARHPAAQSHLARQFQQRGVRKRYEAIVLGQPDPARGSVNKPLLVDWPQRPRQRVNVQWGKPALTHFDRLGPWPLPHGGAAPAPSPLPARATRVALYPITGRSHQLRVHLQWIGHPILGDEFYAPPAWQPGGSPAAPGRLLLHACQLALQHPASGAPCVWSSPAPF